MTKLSFKGKRLIIFDLDGTIIKLNVDWRSLKERLNKRYSKLYSDEDCGFSSISRCLNEIVKREDNEELLNFFDIIRERELEGIEGSKIIDEAVYFIKNIEKFELNPDVNIAIMSLNTHSTVENALKYAGVLEHVDYIIGREDVRKWKPNPEGLLKIQQKFNVEKGEIIYLGDMNKDLETGKRAGVDSFLIDELIDLVNKKREGA